MNTTQLQSFICVVESQSFNQAEKKLFISRQALKKQIDSLEDELGFDLFIRSHIGTTLTPVGEEFYHGIKEINEEIDNLITRCRDVSNHEYTIKIGSPAKPRLILERAFSEFSRQFPYIKQEIVFINEPTTMNAVLDGTVDVAECILTPSLDDSRIGFQKLAELSYKCLVVPEHPLASKEVITFEDLEGYTVGLRRSGNNRIIQKIHKDHPAVSLIETKGSNYEQQQIFTICYNNGIFLSRAYYANFMAPLITIPLDSDIISESGIIFKRDHSSIVHNFLEVTKQCFSKNTNQEKVRL